MRTCLFWNKHSILNLSLYKRSREIRHSEIYSGLRLIFALFLNFKIVGVKVFFCAYQANIVFFSPFSQKIVLYDLFLSRKTTKIVNALRRIFFNLVSILAPEGGEIQQVTQRENHLLTYISKSKSLHRVFLPAASFYLSNDISFSTLLPHTIYFTRSYVIGDGNA